MLGSILSAGANIIGGILGSQSADKARDSTERMAAQNIALQKEFAQSGIQWRVEDARRAGIHPIYALGSGGATFSPVTANFSGDDSLAKGFAAAGQDLGRAIDAGRTGPQKIDAFTRTAQALQLEKAGLENEVLKLEVASKAGRLRQVTQPAIPAAVDPYLIPGQGNSPLISSKALEVTPAPKNAPQSEGGAIPDVGYARTGTGWTPVPSNDVKNRIEDQVIPELLWSLRNNVFPSVGYNFNPPPFKAPDGKEWHFDVLRQEYQLRPKGQGWWERGFTVRDERK